MGERFAVSDESPFALTTETLVIPPDLLYSMLTESPESALPPNSATNTSNNRFEWLFHDFGPR